MNVFLYSSEDVMQLIMQRDELVASLNKIIKSITLAGIPERACEQYQLEVAQKALSFVDRSTFVMERQAISDSSL